MTDSCRSRRVDATPARDCKAKKKPPMKGGVKVLGEDA